MKPLGVYMLRDLHVGKGKTAMDSPHLRFLRGRAWYKERFYTKGLSLGLD